MTYGRAIALAMTVVTVACNQGKGEIDVPGAAFDVRVVAATYVRTADPFFYRIVLAPQPQRSVRVTWRGQTRAVETDADGNAHLAGIAASVTYPVALELAAVDDEAAVSVFGWPHASLIVPVQSRQEPLVVDDPAALAPATSVVSGGIVGWSGSGFGQRNETYLAWRHVEGLVVDREAGAATDVYARTGLDDGRDRGVCTCTDAATIACLEDPANDAGSCACPEDAIVCSNPGGMAGTISGYTLVVPPGTIELGFAERITDYENHFVAELGRLYYAPDFDVPADAALRDLLLEPVIAPSQDQCQTEGFQGAMDLRLDGIGREYVIAARGAMRLELDLVSPFGLRIPLLQHERWPQSRVVSRGTTAQQLLVPYPYALTGPLDGFSYGFQFAATSQSLPVAGGVRYRYEVVRTQPAGIVDPCVIHIGVETHETVFAAPTTTSPFNNEAERTIQWAGSSGPLRQFTVYDDTGGRIAVAWVFDESMTVMPLGEPPTEQWFWSPGDYRMRYDIIAPPDDGLDPSVLVRREVARYRELGSYFGQTHPFRIQ